METRTYTIEKPAKKKWKKGCLIPIAIFLALIIIGVATNGADNAKDASTKVKKTAVELALENATEVDYKTLYQDYIDNAIAADSKYKDKMLVLTGEVGDIDREAMGHPYITFKIDDYLKHVQIVFNKDEEEKIAKLSKGQTIKIVGTCKGSLLGTSVLMEDCLLVE